ncbi:protein FAM217B isoform X2 [Aquarana catesbeiana]|uniref:protein FAM217B isoform X2 n=1 Tax=Aquarana catesbeiana TaxID=8400 RepID=UPI003CC97EB4
MSQKRSRSVRSKTEELPKCGHLKNPMRKSHTFSNAQKLVQPSTLQYTTEGNLGASKLVSQSPLKHSLNKKMYPDNPQQPIGAQNKSKVQKKESFLECSRSEQFLTDGLVLYNGTHDHKKGSGINMLQPGYLNAQHISYPIFDKSSSKNVTCFPHEKESMEKLFLDLELVKLTKEDEDSASDLSDSERLPIPPSPLSPPELNLRAEEISPGYFSHYLQPKGKDYDYPDFLPPPYNSWNLSDVSEFLNKEGKNALKATPSGFLDRYVDRLLQLEWLQLQTVQAEKSKMTKSRPQTAPGFCRNGKFLGKSKSWHSPSPSKQNSNQDNVFKLTCAQEKSSHTKNAHQENCDLTCPRKSPSKVPGLADVPTSVFKQTQDVKVGTKKKSAPNYQQTKDSASGSSSKMNNSGNLRPQKQSALSNYSLSTPKQAKSCKLKKNNCQPATLLDTDYSIAKRNGNPSHSPSYKMK